VQGLRALGQTCGEWKTHQCFLNKPAFQMLQRCSGHGREPKSHLALSRQNDPLAGLGTTAHTYTSPSSPGCPSLASCPFSAHPPNGFLPPQHRSPLQARLPPVRKRTAILLDPPPARVQRKAAAVSPASTGRVHSGPPQGSGGPEASLVSPSARAHPVSELHPGGSTRASELAHTLAGGGRGPALSTHTSGSGRGPALTAHTSGSGCGPALSTHTSGSGCGPALSTHTSGSGRGPALSTHTSGSGCGPALTAHTSGSGCGPALTAHTSGSGCGPALTAHTSGAGGLRARARKNLCSPATPWPRPLLSPRRVLRRRGGRHGAAAECSGFGAPPKKETCTKRVSAVVTAPGAQLSRS
jgi:hypothetical protein